MAAELKLHSKKVFKNGLVVEMKIWEIQGSKTYPDGFRYSLIAINPEDGSKVLMDNHNPKGHHYHVNDDEFPYLYQNLDRLIADFRNLVLKHLGVKL